MAGAPELTLRPFTSEDVDRLMAWETDSEVRRWMGGRFSSPGEARQWFLLVRKSRSRKVYVIQAGTAAIGYIVLENINYRAGSLEVRICIGDGGFRNRGFGQRAITSLLDMMRRKAAFKEVYLRVDPDNVRAIRCYEKCGFRKEGILRRSSNVAGDLLLMSCRLA
ncbi:MAG: GNAT family N-acetyltransferase [Firmicutes bacterium]|nr:GNAT family N-acetyltransferase [Bacillota bacterium]